MSVAFEYLHRIRQLRAHRLNGYENKYSELNKQTNLIKIYSTRSRIESDLSRFSFYLFTHLK